MSYLNGAAVDLINAHMRRKGLPMRAHLLPESCPSCLRWRAEPRKPGCTDPWHTDMTNVPTEAVVVVGGVDD